MMLDTIAGDRAASRSTLRHGAMVAAPMLLVLGLHARAQSLPDAPSTVQQEMLASTTLDGLPQKAQDKTPPSTASGAPCDTLSWSWKLKPQTSQRGSCEDPLQMIVTTGKVVPLTGTQKAVLAGRNVIDPFNLITITGYSSIYVAANSHSAYGPGFKGFGRLTGYSLLEDTQGEFFGVFLIPTLAHEDPRYHRDPGRRVSIRILHALAHTAVTQHDDGTLMPNYATLLTYPISAELSNLYVPGIGTNGRATADRILLGYATDPAGALVAEFLPDVAKRIHIRVVFVQQILNNIATRQ